MKARLPQTEPLRIKAWQQQGTYSQMLRPNTSTQFLMIDGPPYANGKLHVGHVLNKVLKDIVIKYKNMRGLRAPFVPGWDCHGLPIELQSLKKLKSQPETAAGMRQHCHQEALRWVQVQKQQFERLGILALWEQPYLTLNPSYEAQQLRLFAQITKRGLIYRGTKPVFWCPKLQTALAATEAEYRDIQSHCIYAKFYCTPASLDFLKGLGIKASRVAFLAWTTTPWTLVANEALCLHPKIGYAFFKHQDEVLIFAPQLLEQIQNNTQTTLTHLDLSAVPGGKLEGLKLQHPLFATKEVPVVLGEHVTLDTGTACVHTAPGHGMDDHHVGVRYKLPLESHIDTKGVYKHQVPEFAGEHYTKVLDQILNQLAGRLFGTHTLKHSYPHNPRTLSPLVFLSTPQWFLKMGSASDGHGTSLRAQALKELEHIQFTPSWGKRRLKAMLQNAPDWCLSRQRSWGVPVPVFYCQHCHTPLLNFDIIQKVADATAQHPQASAAFYDTPAAEFTAGHQCSNCPSTEFYPGKDIMDVWFDSGAAHSCVGAEHKDFKTPQCDLYLEGSDQHRGWFLTSLLSSVAAYGHTPYKALLTHGFVNDSKGRKMSKSAGNVVDPEKIINQHGAEILRLWVACEDYGQDIKFSQQTLDRVRETYRRFRNVLRFLLANLYDFAPDQDLVPVQKMHPIDQWALMQLHKLCTEALAAYEAYNFCRLYQLLSGFFTTQLSALYLDILKDCLYTAYSRGHRRRSCQSALYHHLQTLVPLMAPVVSFLSEECYQHMPLASASLQANKRSSVFQVPISPPPQEWHRPQIDAAFAPLLALRTQVLKQCELMREQKTIGSSLEAQVQIVAPPNSLQMQSFTAHKAALNSWLIVSQTSLQEGDTLNVTVTKAEGKKCPRCWHYHETPNSLCPKCVEALDQQKGATK